MRCVLRYRCTVMRVSGAGLCALIGLYWIVVAGSGWPDAGWCFWVFLWVATLAPLLAVAVTVRGPDRGRDALVRAGALGIALFAIAGPFLLNEWIRGGDGVRYSWIIHQRFPCSTMGGGPGFLWVAGTAWLYGIGALVFATAGRSGPMQLREGVAVGAALVAMTGLAMFPEPSVFAWLLGRV